MKNNLISKLILFSALTAMSTNVNAQYSGGNGRGDVSARTATCSSYVLPLAAGITTHSLIHNDGADLHYVTSSNLSGQCVSLAHIVDAAGGNVLGNTTVAMNIHLVAQQNSTQRFCVPRFVTITPSSNGNANITLNYTQADFNEFNSKAVFQAKLPTSSADVTGIANFKMYRSAFATYESATNTLIPATLTWNASTNLWEVSMTNVSAQGNFFISTDFVTSLGIGSMTHAQITPLTDEVNARVSLDWADVVGATRYVVRHRPVGASINAWVYDTMNTSNIVLNNLVYATNYEVQVRVRVNTAIQGEFSPSYTFMAPNQLPICASPSSLSHNVTSSNSVTFNWSSVANAISYQVRYRVANTIFWGGTSTAGLSRTFNYLNPLTEYEYQVRTKCVLNTTRTQWGPFSSATKFTTLPAPPSETCLPPTNISVNINNGNSVTITWDTAANDNSYLVQLKKATDTVWGGGSTLTNSRSFNFLAQNTKYYYRIRTSCIPNTTINGTSAFTTIDSFTTPSVKSLPNLGVETFASNWVVYPNPTSDVVNIQFAAAKDAEVTVIITDITGRVIKSSVESVVMGANVINLNIADVVNGLYTVQVVQDNNVRFVSKLNKQ